MNEGLQSPLIHRRSKSTLGENEGEESWLQRVRSSHNLVIVMVSLALFSDMVLYDVIVPLLPALLRKAGQSEAMIGPLFAVYSVGYLVFTPLFGVWSDRLHNRRTPLLWGQVGMLLASLLFALAGRSFLALMLARLLQGVAAACSWTLGLALLADVFGEDGMGQAMGIVFGCNTLGYFVGPLLGGILGETVSLEMPFWVCVCLAAFDLACRWLCKPQENSEAPMSQEGVSMGKLLGYREVQVIGLVIALSAASFAAIETMLASHLQSSFQLGMIGVSMVMMAMIVPSTAFSILAGHWSDRHCRYLLLCLSLMLYAPSPLFLGLSTHLFGFILAAAYFGATSSLLSAPTLPEMGAIVARLGGSSYARIYAIVNMAYSLGMLLGPLWASFGHHRWGFGLTMATFSLSLAALLPLVYQLRLQAQQGKLASQSPLIIS